MSEGSNLLSGSIDIARYVDNVTHQMKTPITVIKTYLELMEAELYGPIDPRLSSKIDLISTNMDEIHYFLEQMNDVILMATMEKDPEPDHHDISETLDRALNDIGPIAVEKGISIRKETMDGGIQALHHGHWTRRALCNVLRFIMIVCPTGISIGTSIERSGGKVSVKIIAGGMEDIDMEQMTDSMSRKEGAGSTLDWERFSLPIARNIMRSQGADLAVLRENDEVIGLSVDIPEKQT